MKKFMSAAALLMIASLAVTPIAADDTNANNKISIAFYFAAGNQGGIFSIAGAGDPRGTAEVTGRTLETGADGSPRIRLTKVMHFADGDIFLSTDGTLVTNGPVVESSGTWIMTSGNGTYVNVTGEGNYHWCRTLATGNLVGAYTGKMKLDRDGD